MHDCLDGTMRDHLPLYVNGMLDAAERTRVAVHIQECAECADDVALLRAAVRAYAVAPVDVVTIAAHLPTARAARRARPFHRQPLWQMAAAITMMIAGTATVVVVRGPGVAQAPIATVDSGLAVRARGQAGRAEESTLAMARGSVPVSPRGITFGGNLSDLTDAQLEALLALLERIDGTVSADPETLAMPLVPTVDTRRNP